MNVKNVKYSQFSKGIISLMLAIASLISSVPPTTIFASPNPEKSEIPIEEKIFNLLFKDLDTLNEMLLILQDGIVELNNNGNLYPQNFSFLLSKACSILDRYHKDSELFSLLTGELLEKIKETDENLKIEQTNIETAFTKFCAKWLTLKQLNSDLEEIISLPFASQLQPDIDKFMLPIEDLSNDAYDLTSVIIKQIEKMKALVSDLLNFICMQMCLFDVPSCEFSDDNLLPSL